MDKIVDLNEYRNNKNKINESDYVDIELYNMVYDAIEFAVKQTNEYNRKIQKRKIIKTTLLSLGVGVMIGKILKKR